ncbi:MAG: hypothetical protein ABXS92_03800 [Sulfurimonas sp.]
MQNHSPKFELLLIPIATPLLIGLYRDGELIETLSSDKKTSQILLPLLKECMDRYALSNIIYTRGPGSYMAIKLTYVMLKTIETTKGIRCLGCSAFALNGGAPIKAVGNLYFAKEKETIITKKIEQPAIVEFTLPQSIHDLPLDEESEPEYRIPAV